MQYDEDPSFDEFTSSIKCGNVKDAMQLFENWKQKLKKTTAKELRLPRPEFRAEIRARKLRRLMQRLSALVHETQHV